MITISFVILLPILVSYLYAKAKAEKLWSSYLVIISFFFFYPFVFLQLDNYFNPPSEEAVCGMPMLGLVMSIWMVGTPIALLILFLCNLIRKRNKQETV